MPNAKSRERCNDRSKGSPNAQEKASQPEAKCDSELVRSGQTIFISAVLCFLGRLGSGLLGIGGGVLIVPIMVVAMEMPIHYAAATSMFTMIFTSISGVA